MNVCHVTSVHGPFDVRIFYKECTTLAHAGHQVTLMAQAEWPERRVDGVHVVALPKVTKRSERVRLWRLIVQRVKQLRPDVVHFHDPELLVIAPLFRPARLIYDCHEPYAETMLVRRWIPGPLRYTVSQAVALLEPLLARRVDAVIVTEDSHIDIFRRGSQPVTLLYNYPLLSQFDFVRHSDGRAHSDGQTIIHVGILSEGRGAWTMIEAMNLVVQRVPQARLLLVGRFDSPPDEKETRRLIASHGLEKAVEIVGSVPFTDLPQWLARADVGLVPWHTVDKLPQNIIPTKLFEYMGSGLPVLASNRATIRRFVDGLDCGLLVQPGDARELAEGIEYLLCHPSDAKRMGQNGRRAVESQYHWASEGEKLTSLYRRIATL